MREIKIHVHDSDPYELGTTVYVSQTSRVRGPDEYNITSGPPHDDGVWVNDVCARGLGIHRVTAIDYDEAVPAQTLPGEQPRDRHPATLTLVLDESFPMSPAAIKQWRAERVITRADLARLLPVPYRTLEDWEAGKASPPAYLRRALADIDRELAE